MAQVTVSSLPGHWVDIMNPPDPVTPWVDQAVTFQIPAGVWTSATWNITGIVNTDFAGDAVPRLHSAFTGGGVSRTDGHVIAGIFPWSDTWNASVGQLTDINSAQGSTVSATIRVAVGIGGQPPNYYEDDVASCFLVLTGTPSGGGGGGSTSDRGGGFQWAWRKGRTKPSPAVVEVLVGMNTAIYAGKPLVLTINPVYTGTGSSQYPVVRCLQYGDTISTSIGLIGVALFDMQTDANGKIMAVTEPVTIDRKGRFELQMSYTNDQAIDPKSGFLRIPIMSFEESNVFSVYTALNEAASFYDLNRSAGIVVSSVAVQGGMAPQSYGVDLNTAAGSSCLVVEGIDSEDARFNSAGGGGRVFVSCKPDFYARNMNGGWFT